MGFWLEGRPLMIAHRGLSAHAPENTLVAFRMALERGADGIELDLQPSADGVPMVIHDATLERTTDGRGAVRERTAREIQQYDAGGWFHPDFAGERVPTLYEVFEAFGTRLRYNLELKVLGVDDQRIVAPVIEAIRAFGLSEQVLISSFFLPALNWVKAIAPEIPCALIIPQPKPNQQALSWWTFPLPFEAFHPHDSVVKAEHVAHVRQGGKRVGVWTVNDLARKAELTAWGVDVILTDSV